MQLTEIAVILIGLVAGYWAVSKLFFGDSKAATIPPPAGAPSSSGSRWYEVLGVAPLASESEVRSAYQHLVSQYHPDKVDNLGPELKSLAIQKTQQITAAYREAMRLRGVDA